MFEMPKTPILTQSDFGMIGKIWRILAQILFYRNDLIITIKTFFENWKKENINDEKYIPLLKTFSKYQLEVLYQNGIITKEKFNFLLLKKEKDENQNNPKDQSSKLSIFNVNENCSTNIEAIVSGDKIQELQDLIHKKDIQTFNIITKSFLEIKEMKIPLIKYCIMKKG